MPHLAVLHISVSNDTHVKNKRDTLLRGITYAQPSYHHLLVSVMRSLLLESHVVFNLVQQFSSTVLCCATFILGCQTVEQSNNK